MYNKLSPKANVATVYRIHGTTTQPAIKRRCSHDFWKLVRSKRVVSYDKYAKKTNENHVWNKTSAPQNTASPSEGGTITFIGNKVFLLYMLHVRSGSSKKLTSIFVYSMLAETYSEDSFDDPTTPADE